MTTSQIPASVRSAVRAILIASAKEARGEEIAAADRRGDRVEMIRLLDAEIGEPSPEAVEQEAAEAVAYWLSTQQAAIAAPAEERTVRCSKRVPDAFDAARLAYGPGVELGWWDKRRAAQTPETHELVGYVQVRARDPRHAVFRRVAAV